MNSSLEPDFSAVTFYTVEPGDTLRGISEKIFGDPERYRRIMELNGLKNTVIYPGQILRVPESMDSKIVIYRVSRGDRLWSIAKKFLGRGERYEEIMVLNGLTTDMIYPGQILKIPVESSVSPRIYIVRQGDTLWKIATEFLGDGKRYSEIIKLNNLENGDITVGQRLNLPPR